MATNYLYYGNGVCTLEASNARAILIRYGGSIKIQDKTSDSFILRHKNNKIMIVPIGNGNLTELFEYSGNFEIYHKHIIYSDNEDNYTSIKRVMDFSELITSNSEDITTISENLNSGYIKTKQIIEKKPILKNLNTAQLKSNLYLENGEIYSGNYHIHLDTKKTMSGSEHSENAVMLYRKIR